MLYSLAGVKNNTRVQKEVTWKTKNKKMGRVSPTQIGCTNGPRIDSKLHHNSDEEPRSIVYEARGILNSGSAWQYSVQTG